MFAASKTDGVVAGGPPPSGDPYWTSVSLLTNFENNLTFRDESTNNFAITRNGVVNPSLRTPFSSGVGGSEYFNGSTGYLTVPLNAALNFGTGDFTFECWVYFNALTLGNIFDGAVNGLSVSLNPSNQLSLGHSNVAYLIADTAAATTGSWFHVVGVRAGTTLSLFKNGTRVATASNSTNFSTTVANRIGWNGSAAYFSGFISNLRIVKGTAVYDPTLTTLTVPTAPLTAITNTSLLITGTGQGMFNNSTFVDQGPNALTVTATGSPVYSGRSPFGNTYPGSVLLNGTSQYLSTPSSSTLDILSGGDFTVECWFYANTITANGGFGNVLFSREGIAGVDGWNFRISPSGIEFVYGGLSGNLQSFTFSTSTWYHVVAQRTGSAFAYYINGTKYTPTYSNRTVDSASPLRIGLNGYTLTPAYFNGYISNARIVKGTAVYTSNFTPSTTPLTAITNTSLLVRGDTGAFYDLSNNGLAETGVGSPVVTTQIKKYGIESLFLNGSSSYLTMPMNTAFDFGAGDFTVELWVYLTATPTNYKTIIGAWGGTTNGWILAFFSNTTKPGFQLNYTGTPGFITGSTAVTLNTWNHIAVVKSGTTATLYLNGISTASSTGVGTLITAVGNVAIGTNLGDAANQAFPGYLDDIRITKGVARYTANFTPPTATFPTGP